MVCYKSDRTEGKYRYSTKFQKNKHFIIFWPHLKFVIGYFAVARVTPAVFDMLAFSLALKFFITRKFFLFQATPAGLNSHLPTLGQKQLKCLSKKQLTFQLVEKNIYCSTFSFMTSFSAFMNAAFEQFPASVTASTDLYCARHCNGLFPTWTSTLQLRFIQDKRLSKQGCITHSHDRGVILLTGNARGQDAHFPEWQTVSHL